MRRKKRCKERMQKIKVEMEMWASEKRKEKTKTGKILGKCEELAEKYEGM